MAAPTIVFDLDGTLVDTAPDLIATLDALFVREGLPAPDGELRNMIGGGARRLIERALERKNVKTSADEVQRLYAGFIEHYTAHVADRSRPFPDRHRHGARGGHSRRRGGFRLHRNPREPPCAGPDHQPVR